MVGKAWTYGLIPYVDVIDIKGPLLFAFFSVGYLIHGAIGVYILFALCLYATILGMYHIAKLYTSSEVYSVLIAIIALSYYLVKFRADGIGRPEDIMLPSLLWSIYACLNSIVHSDDIRRLYAAARILGINAALISLIKYNALLPMACCALLLLVFAAQNSSLRAGILRFILIGFSYFTIIIALMAVFLYTQGALYPCIDVYCNIVRAASMNDCMSIEYNIRMLVSMKYLHVSLLLGMWLIRMLDGSKQAKWTAALWVTYAFGVYVACFNGFHYYYIITVPLILFPCIAAAPLYDKFLSAWKIYISAMGVLAIGCSLYPDLLNVWQRIQNPAEYKNSFDEEISKIKNARLLYIDALDLGLGVSCDALPACPYWMTLNGDVFNAMEKQWQCVKERIPDFVIIHNREGRDMRVEESGYTLIGEKIEGRSEMSLWRKM